jgi:hypothetical protein
MSIILWITLALVGGLAAVALSARRTLVRPAPLELEPGETLAPTALQRLARLTLGVGVVPLAIAWGMVAVMGVDRFYRQDTIRVTVTLLLMAALLILAGFSFRAHAWGKIADGPLDERDQEILAKAPMFEGGPMLVTLAFWVVGLQQTFWTAGAVPLAYLYLVFWSMLMVKALALPIGVLIGYRRS